MTSQQDIETHVIVWSWNPASQTLIATACIDGQSIVVDMTPVQPPAGGSPS